MRIIHVRFIHGVIFPDGTDALSWDADARHHATVEEVNAGLDFYDFPRDQRVFVPWANVAYVARGWPRS